MRYHWARAIVVHGRRAGTAPFPSLGAAIRPHGERYATAEPKFATGLVDIVQQNIRSRSCSCRHLQCFQHACLSSLYIPTTYPYISNLSLQTDSRRVKKKDDHGKRRHIPQYLTITSQITTVFPMAYPPLQPPLPTPQIPRCACWTDPSDDQSLQ